MKTFPRPSGRSGSCSSRLPGAKIKSGKTNAPALTVRLAEGVLSVMPSRQKQEALDRAMAAEAAFAQQAAANSRHATAIHDQLRSARANLAAATAEANSELVAARRAREAADKQAQAVRALLTEAF